MKNREVYRKDPAENRLFNHGVVELTDIDSAEERRTLRYELETFVCDGEYAKGPERSLRTYLDNLHQAEQPGVWYSAALVPWQGRPCWSRSARPSFECGDPLSSRAED